MKYIELAERIIAQAFLGKKDLVGEDYVKHLFRVQNNVLKEWSNAYDYVQAAALLHDILEDCPEWNETSLRQVFNDSIVDLVVILTKGKNEPYSDYIDRIKNCGDHNAIRIKIADLQDNMDITRLKEVSEKDAKRLDKYIKAYWILKE